MTTHGKRTKIVLTPVPLDSALPEVTHFDWLAFTISPSNSESDPIPTILWRLAALFKLPSIPAVCKGKGWNGYDRRYDLSNGQDVSLGLLASGGGKKQRGTVHIELNAHACAVVLNWQAFAEWGNSLQARITRIDFAHDDHGGETFNMEKMVDWYKQGLFIVADDNHATRRLATGLQKVAPWGVRCTLENARTARCYESMKRVSIWAILSVLGSGLNLS